jgi:hypothetical protein
MTDLSDENTPLIKSQEFPQSRMFDVRALNDDDYVNCVENKDDIHDCHDCEDDKQ